MTPSKVLITGITGTIGTELTKILLGLDHEVVGLSRDEFKQARFEYKDKVDLHIGDVRDLDAVIRASMGCDIIIHTAALKHVDLMEMNPHESIRTNVNGTENILDAQVVNGVDKVCLLSTDKAVYPINVYGYSKAIAERITMRRSRNNLVVRYGNVLGSRGSVIESFKQQLVNGGIYNLTDPRMTRFWIRINDVANYIVESILKETGGLYVPEMKASPVATVADAVLSEIQGIDCEGSPHIIGMRPGEKINECLISRYEMGDVRGRNEEPWGRHRDIYSDSEEQYTLKEMRELVRGEL